MGTRVIRTEDPRLLTEGGMYVGDLPFRDVPELRRAAVVVFVRSTMAHARLTNVDTTAAKASPGVYKVITAADIAHLPKQPSPFPGVVPDPYLRPLLATDRVRFVGEPIAVIIAESQYLGD